MPPKATIAFGLGLTLLGAALKVLLGSNSALLILLAGVILILYAILTSHAGSPLEIIFDADNPARRFWSMESFLDENGKKRPGGFWEYRVEIKNKSSKTVKNVSVSTERIGQMAQRPFDHAFDKTQKIACDIRPGCSELIAVVRWPIPIKQVGMLAGETALEYGPIKVIASGDDSKPTTRLFKFDYQKEPMLRD